MELQNVVDEQISAALSEIDTAHERLNPEEMRSLIERESNSVSELRTLYRQVHHASLYLERAKTILVGAQMYAMLADRMRTAMREDGV